MSQLKLCLIIMLLSLYSSIFAEEDILRIGGLDFPSFNYGTIIIGPHQNRDSSNARFANYYLDLSIWVNATLSNENLVTDGDITETKMQPDWYPYHKVQVDTLQQGKEEELKYTTVFRDDKSLEKHQPLGIEVTQELFYQRYRDWAIISLRLKNLNTTNLRNFFISLKLDADVPQGENKPTPNDDMVGQSENLLYLYDKNQTEEKSNIIGLLPLGEDIQFIFNWWNVDADPLNDLQRQQLLESTKGNLPVSVSDYRIMVAQGPFELKARQELDFVCGLIECQRLDNALKVKQEVMDYFKTNLASRLKRMPHLVQSSLEKITPDQYALFQNYPNPFNPLTTIGYAIPEDSDVELTIYNIKGEVVNRLLSAQQKAGIHQILWDGYDKYGSRVSSGIYYYRIKAGSFEMTKKMVLFW